MSQIQDYTNLSLALSEVLSELGLNELIVKKRRRTHLVSETADTLSWKTLGLDARAYVFGSQSEGTTITGLNSDYDIVVCIHVVNVIPELRYWKHGALNFLMVEDEATPPGYCMLQVLSDNDPVPETEIINEHHFRDRQGRILLKNTVFYKMRHDDQEQHGPVFVHQRPNGAIARDVVYAFPCASQLPAVQHWLSVPQGEWPSEDMKRYIASSPCFVVAVGNRGSVNQTFEWRISTSLAERCLMFSLNITQLQVYVLMKMLLKTSINYNVPEDNHISSFMCKTVVLHCVQNTAPNAWQSHMLIQCLLFSLFALYICVVIENCPHFIIRSNNLMAGRFTQQAKYQLQENLRWLLGDNLSWGILSIHIDGVADRLMRKINPGVFGILGRLNDEDCQDICCLIGLNCAKRTRANVREVLSKMTEKRPGGPITMLQKYVQYLEHVYRDGSEIQRSACRILTPFFYTTLGSLLASESIQNSGIIDNQVLDFFYWGLNSDVASSRLKLASAFFCTGEKDRAEIIMRDLEGRYDISVCSPVCVCASVGITRVLTRIEPFSVASDESDISRLTSACVIFTQAEKNCIPHELKYEMYRFTREDLKHRNIWDFWMDWAVVDSLPYLHFLCYKVYGRLQRRADQRRALDNLFVAIQIEPDLGHKETALNLLGQCMEQEERWNHALQCYIWSLNIRPRSNAANFHIGRLLYLRFRQCFSTSLPPALKKYCFVVVVVVVVVVFTTYYCVISCC